MTDDESTPKTLADEIGEAALEAAKAYAEENGVELKQCFVYLYVDGVPEELNATSCGYGFEDGADLLASLLSTCRAMAKQMGLKLEFVDPDLN